MLEINFVAQKPAKGRSFGGVLATLSFSGLVPGFVGLYQVNVQVPNATPSGAQVPVEISIGGVSSNIVTIAVN